MIGQDTIRYDIDQFTLGNLYSTFYHTIPLFMFLFATVLRIVLSSEITQTQMFSEIVSARCKKKFVYDLWGDAVNTAGRMESHGQAGRIQVSAATARLLHGEFDVESRGFISVKGKGDLETFTLRH